MNLVSPTEAKFSIRTSSELDYLGYVTLRDEIIESHPLRSQFIQSCESVFGKETIAKEKVLTAQEIRSAIDDFYSTHNILIQQSADATQAAWKKREVAFLSACDNLFSGKQFHENETRTLYPSVFGVYIQNINEKAVSFPYKPKNLDEAMYVIVHEILHVFFYQYINQQHKELRQKIDSSMMWHMAEIFNSVVLKSHTFRAFYPDFTATDYDTHKIVINELSELLGDTFTADEFVEAYTHKMM